MGRPASTRTGVLAALGIGLAGFGLMVSAGVSVDSSDLPDLEPLLPKNHSNVNDRWIDTVQVSGRTLFRFDTVILNTGAGAFEVIRDGAGSPTQQYVWENKVPPGQVTTSVPPPVTGPSGERRLVASAGSSQAIAYSSLIGHNHFHTQLIAGYQLLTQGGALVNAAAKNSAGFCLYDSWGSVAAYDAALCRSGQSGWTGAIRMGISPGRGDFYGSQLGDQWIDVTGVTPGTYALRAEVNPAGIYDETDTSNNAVTENGIVIPGAIAAAASASTPVGTAVDIPLAGSLVGATVKSRRPSCSAGQTTEASCMQTATAGRLTFAAGAPSAGAVQLIDAAPDLAAVARFTPPAGFTGSATFTYTATDSRGLRSAPATVTVTVTSGPGAPPPVPPPPVPPIAPPPAPPAAVVTQPAPVAPPAPAGPTALSAKVSGALTVRRGALLRVKIVFDTVQRRTPVGLQRRVGSRWVAMGARPVSGRSTIFSVRLGSLGQNRLRIVFLDNGRPRVTPVRVVRVLPVPPARRTR
jgi:hypothetical protein